MTENDGAGAGRGAGGRRTGTERGAEVTDIGWSAERLFRRSNSAYGHCILAHH